MLETDLELSDDHVYSLGGVTIPGCTSVLTAMGASKGFGFLSSDDLEFYRSRGHAVHKSIELMIRGTLDKRTVAKEIKPYLIGWERFCNDYPVDVLSLDNEPFVERPIHHSAFRYGVTPDVVARVKRESGPIELKVTSAHAPATAIQLAAQLLAIRQVADVGEMRWGLRLLPKEPYYDLRRYTDKTDQAIWLSLLNVYSWRKTHKLL